MRIFSPQNMAIAIKLVRQIEAKNKDAIRFMKVSSINNHLQNELPQGRLMKK